MLLGVVVLAAGGVLVLGAVRGWLVVVVPLVMPPMLVVGEVFPIGGVVPGVVLGVVPGVVLGVVPVVVLGVVGAAVLGMAAGVLGGHKVEELEAELGDVLGIVALGLVAVGLEVLMPGEAEELAAEGAVDGTGHVVAGVPVDVAELVLWAPLVAAGAFVDWDPGTVAVGATAPEEEGVCASAVATANDRMAESRIARGLIHLSSWGSQVGWVGQTRGMSRSRGVFRRLWAHRKERTEVLHGDARIYPKEARGRSSSHAL